MVRTSRQQACRDDGTDNCTGAHTDGGLGQVELLMGENKYDLQH
jgi:hypothetical protein